MRLILLLLLALVCGAALLLLSDAPQIAALAHWAAGQQRSIQNAMAGSLQALKAGEPMALATLCLLSAGYGLVHALGPGHGKILLGGAALASGTTLRRMLWLSLVSSLAQSGTAILLVLVGVKLLALTSTQAIGLTEDWLAPASYAAVGLIGVILAFRGLRTLLRPSGAECCTPRAEPCGCGHSHGPTATQISTLNSRREMATLVASIALRPCTGALFLLVIAWRFGIPWSGALAVIAMGLGTALFNGLVVCGGVGLRQLVRLAEGPSMLRWQTATAALHVIAGSMIVMLMAGMLLSIR